MMSGNTIGKLFRVTSFGESHGRCVGVVVDGCPPGLKISEKHIGLKIRTFGEVQNISYYADITTFTLESQNYTLKCIYFGKLKYPLHKGEIIIAEGKISKYKGSLELIIEKVS